MMEYLSEIEIGVRCRDLREQAGLTQAEIGTAIGLDQSAVSRIELGERTLSARDIALLSDALGTTVSRILSDPAGTGRKVLLRANDATDTDIVESIARFQECIDDYEGVLALSGSQNSAS